MWEILRGSSRRPERPEWLRMWALVMGNLDGRLLSSRNQKALLSGGTFSRNIWKHSHLNSDSWKRFKRIKNVGEKRERKGLCSYLYRSLGTLTFWSVSFLISRLTVRISGPSLLIKVFGIWMIEGVQNFSEERRDMLQRWKLFWKLNL